MDRATTRLREGARALGVELDDRQVRQLVRYLALLLEWNRHINLTSVTEPIAIVERHFLDSLAVVRALKNEETLLDVGSGAGFPGFVIAVALPKLRVTCVESIQKKAAFLQTLRREVQSCEVLAARLENLDRARRFAVVVSRATWDPAEWLTRGAPWVSDGGLLIAMQTAEQEPLSPPDGFAALSPIVYSVGGAARRLGLFRRQ